MIPKGDGKSESSKTDAEELTRVIELEMAQNRAAWARTEARNRRIRTFSFAFLAIVVIGALLAFFLLFTRVSQERPGQGARAEATATP
jgi:hypothetical protein